MIASSTIAPTAIAMPPSVMLLIVAPVSFIASTAVSSDSGIANSVIDAARTLARNRKTIRTTRMLPSRSARVRLSIAVSMKLAWRKMFRSIVMPAGSDRCSSSRTPSRRSVSSSVLAPGCFWIPMTIAGSPSCDPSPRRSAGPIATSPRSRTRMGRPSRAATTVSPISARLSGRPIPRIRYSCPPETRKPADVLRFAL